MENKTPYDITEAALQYMYRTQELGAFEGALGEQAPSPEVLELFNAFHAVLAGGKVNVEIVDEGSKEIASELNGDLLNAIQAANKVNAEAGTYVTLVSA